MVQNDRLWHIKRYTLVYALDGFKRSPFKPALYCLWKCEICQESWFAVL